MSWVSLACISWAQQVGINSVLSTSHFNPQLVKWLYLQNESKLDAMWTWSCLNKWGETFRKATFRTLGNNKEAIMIMRRLKKEGSGVDFFFFLMVLRVDFQLDIHSYEPIYYFYFSSYFWHAAFKLKRTIDQTVKNTHLIINISEVAYVTDFIAWML